MSLSPLTHWKGCALAVTLVFWRTFRQGFRQGFRRGSVAALVGISVRAFRRGSVAGALQADVFVEELLALVALGQQMDAQAADVLVHVELLGRVHLFALYLQF